MIDMERFKLSPIPKARRKKGPKPSTAEICEGLRTGTLTAHIVVTIEGQDYEISPETDSDFLQSVGIQP